MVKLQRNLFNLGEVSESAAIKTGTPANLAGLKEFKNGLVRYDGQMQKRMGLTTHSVTGIAAGTTVGFSFTPGDKEFMLLCVSNSTPTQRVYVLEKTGGSWGTVPIDFRYSPNNPNSTEYPDQGVSTDWAPTPFTEAELQDVRAVEYGDRIFLLHENHLPMSLQYGVDPIGTVLGYDAWTIRDDAFGAGPEVGGQRDPRIFTFSTRVGNTYARVSVSSPTFTGNDNMDITNGVYGSVFRIGDAVRTDDSYYPYGQFYVVERVIGKTVADMQIATQPGSTGTYRVADTNDNKLLFDDERVGNDWAGPWRDSGLTQSFNLTVNLGPGETTTTTAASGRERIGEIWLLLSGFSTVSAILLVVDATDSDVTVANVGTTLTIQNFAGTLHRMLPGPESGIAIMSELGFPTSSSDKTGLSFIGIEGLPEGHETLFQEVSFNKSGVGNRIDCGGVVFLNGGVFRVTDRDDPTATANDNALTWRGYWEVLPNSAAPTSSWGYGWSKATGFPSVGITHQQRLMLSGFKSPGTAVVGSRPRYPLQLNAIDWLTQDDAPLNLNLTTGDDSERVRWMRSANEHVHIGTDRGEYSLRGVPLSPASIGLEFHSKYGSVQAPGGVASVGPLSAYLAEEGQTIREMQNEQNTDQFISPNILAASSHLLDSGESFEQIVGIRYLFPLYAVRTSAGRLLFLSRDIENNISAPSFCTNASGNMTKECESIWVSSGEGTYDVLWAVWKVTTPLTTLYRIGYYEFDRFVDFYSTPSFNLTSVTVDAALVGAVVDLVVDGVWWGRYTVPDDTPTITLDTAFSSSPSVVEAGESFTFIATLPSTDADDTRNGTTASEIRNIEGARLYLVNSYGGFVVEDNTSRVAAMNQQSSAPTVANGWIDVVGVGVNGRDPNFSIQSPHPFPFRVSAVAWDQTL